MTRSIIRLGSRVVLGVLIAAVCGHAQEQEPREAPKLEVQDQKYLAPVTPRQVSPPANPRLGSYVSVQVNVDLAGNNIVGDAANEPSLAVDPNDPTRIVVGWRQFDTINSSFRQAGWGFSHDGGNSWRHPGVIEPTVFRSDPVLDVDADGNFYYSSLRGDFSVWTFVSNTSGASWIEPGHFSHGGDKQWITVDKTGGVPGNGNVYMAWSTAGACCGLNTFSRSTDGGVNWLNPVTPSVNPIWGQLAVGPDNSLYVGGIRGDNFDLATFPVTRSFNAANAAATPTFPQTSFANLGGSVQISTGPNPGGLLGQVNVATDHSGGSSHGNIYLLASIDPPGGDPLNVHFVRSTDGGQTWSTRVKVNDDPNGSNRWQWFGTMSVAPNGRIDAVWNDTRNDASANTSELFYSFSVDAGVTWSTNVAVSPPFNSMIGWPQQSKIGDYYDMVSDNLGAHVAYSATFNGEQDVYYLRIGQLDCNGNGVDDATDISAGTSQDGNGNGVPDECETLLLSPLNPGQAGVMNVGHITRAKPGGGLFLLYGSTSIDVPIGSCAGFNLGILSPSLLGPFFADAGGQYNLSGPVAASLGGTIVYLQAVELGPCRLGNVVEQSFP